MSGEDGQLGSVIAAGQQSRAELAGELAKKFQRDPKRFDPRSLERLGSSGLRQFLEGIGENNSQPNLQNRHQRIQLQKEQTRNKSKVSGWARLRRPEWPVWISGMATGVRAGGIVTGSGLFILFAAERVAPFVREILS